MLFMLFVLPAWAEQEDDFIYHDGCALGGMLLTGYTGNAVNVVVPQTLDGYSVKSVTDQAFAGNQLITSLVLAEGLEKIVPNAFYELHEKRCGKDLPTRIFFCSLTLKNEQNHGMHGITGDCA